MKDEMEHLHMSDDDLLPMFFVLEFRTASQLEAL